MRSIHLVCNAHLDPVWQWEWEEGVAAAISTFRSAANLCEEYDYIFCHNEVILYEWVQEYEPALFERIKDLVKRGKWQIMGGWYVQPDANMPSGESFVRQILLGRMYFEKHFNARPTTAINFDSFGHTRGLVQILAKSGYDSYVFTRPGSHETNIYTDEDFIWVGFDGSKIAARHRDGAYNTHLGKAEIEIKELLAKETDREVNLVLWGVGNHGGGPSRKDLEDLKRMIAEADDRIMHSTMEDYFRERAAGKARPEVSVSLQPKDVGCYTTMARVKKKHRDLENELYMTEKMVSQAVLQGLMEYPAEDLHQVMRDLAFAEFHDILPGSSIQPAEEAAVRLMDHGLEILSRIKARAYFLLASGQEAAHENEYPICVYNPHPYPVKATVTCEFMLSDQNWEKEFSLPEVFRNGELLPCQPEKEYSTFPLDWRKRVVFDAELAPSCMNRFECYTRIVPKRPKSDMKPEDGYYRFNNGKMECWINTRTGLMDKYAVDGKDYLLANSFLPVVIMDDYDPWGMEVVSFTEVCGQFELMTREESAVFSAVDKHELAPVRVIEDGPVRTVIESTLKYKNSRVVLTYKLHKVHSEVEVGVRVYWNEKDRMLKLSVPTVMKNGRYVGQTAFGTDTLLTNEDEVVAHKWTAALDEKGNRAVTLINSSSYGSSYIDGVIKPTLLRSSCYTAHPVEDRITLPADRFLPRIDQGERLFTFYLNAGTCAERMANVTSEAEVHSQPPVAISFSPTGEGKELAPAVTLSSHTVEMTALKKAEKSDAFVIRLYEPTGKGQKVTLKVPLLGIEEKISLGGYEVKTFLMEQGKLTPANLIEEAL